MNGQGKVHNPTGGGIAAFSSSNNNNDKAKDGSTPTPPREQQQQQQQHRNNRHHHRHHPDHAAAGGGNESHPTTKIEVGSSRRNIQRKKTDNAIVASSSGRYDNRSKRMGGTGKGMRADDDPIHHALSYAGDRDGDHGTGAVGALNPNDPLYVPEEDDDPRSYVLSSGGGMMVGKAKDASIDVDVSNATVPSGTYDAIVVDDDDVVPNGRRRPVYGPLLTLTEFKIRSSDIIREYFDSSDISEFIRCVYDLGCTVYHPELIKRCISLGMDEGPRERELISRLLACLHPNPMSDAEMEGGFELVLDSIEDLCIDIPDAKAMAGSFLARAVIDEVLAPAFLSNRNNTHPGDPVVEKAVGLLSREHCTARLERVWGPGDGRPVSELKEIMDQLLKEYLLSRELDEAASCVRELKASHFHHELVKRGIRIAMEEDGGGRRPQ
ncbi:hypothetical protein ACHAXA_009873 [Cyclostephanos tholiformis]|uniref:MI domain-containing protein n=1 Tax=Cyclostephanos tholiformis TaxID=382380 RepID=A0ABD3RDX5_9STRA